MTEPGRNDARSDLFYMAARPADVSIDACAELVARGDPDRFAATMVAPPELRAKLLPLYAFNLEVARAPWVTQEPMIAEMRLQWWADAIDEIFEGSKVRHHEVVTPLAAVIAKAGLERADFDALIAARRLRDAAGVAMDKTRDLKAYIDATSGGLMALAAKAAGADPQICAIARCFGQGSGAANLLTALPALQVNHRMFLPPDPDRVVTVLREFGTAQLRAARQGRSRISRAIAPVFLCGWQADYILSRAGSHENVWNNVLLPSEFRRRLTLGWRALSGRW